MKRIACMLVLMSVAAAVLTTLTGCNTVVGFGKDMERAGSALQRAAR